MAPADAAQPDTGEVDVRRLSQFFSSASGQPLADDPQPAASPMVARPPTEGEAPTATPAPSGGSLNQRLDETLGLVRGIEARLSALEAGHAYQREAMSELFTWLDDYAKWLAEELRRLRPTDPTPSRRAGGEAVPGAST